MADVIPTPINRECLTWRAHLSWPGIVALVVVSVLIAVAIVRFQGVYRDAPPLVQGGQVLTPSTADPDPTFFIVRFGDDLTLIRNREPIAYFLIGLFSIVILFLTAGIYQTAYCIRYGSRGTVRGIGFMHILLPAAIALMPALMWLGAFPLVAEGERIELKPRLDALIINGERFAALHEITSFGGQRGPTGNRGGTRELFVANLGQGKWVVLDALMLGSDVLNSHPGAPSAADYLTDYMREMRQKYPDTMGRSPWPAYGNASSAGATMEGVVGKR